MDHFDLKQQATSGSARADAPFDEGAKAGAAILVSALAGGLIWGLAIYALYKRRR